MGGCMSCCGCCEDNVDEYAVTIMSTPPNTNLLQSIINNGLLDGHNGNGALFRDEEEVTGRSNGTNNAAVPVVVERNNVRPGSTSTIGRLESIDLDEKNNS